MLWDVLTGKKAKVLKDAEIRCYPFSWKKMGGNPSPDRLLVPITSCDQPRVSEENPILCTAALELYHENDTF